MLWQLSLFIPYYVSLYHDTYFSQQFLTLIIFENLLVKVWPKCARYTISYQVITRVPFFL